MFLICCFSLAQNFQVWNNVTEVFGEVPPAICKCMNQIYIIFNFFSAVCLLLINVLISFRRDLCSFLQIVSIYCGNGMCCP